MPARIDEELDASAAAGFEGALAALGSERYTQLLLDLEAWLTDAGLTAEADSLRVWRIFTP